MKINQKQKKKNFKQYTKKQAVNFSENKQKEKLKQVTVKKGMFIEGITSGITSGTPFDARQINLLKNNEIIKKRKISLIRNCWISTIYKKNRSVFSSKQKFINFLTKQGKKSKAFKLLTITGKFIRKKFTFIEKNYNFFKNYDEVNLNILSYSKKLKNSQKITSKAKSFTKSEHASVKSRSSFIKDEHSTINKSLSIDTINYLSFNQLLQQAIDNIKPSFEVRKVRVGGTTYLVPAILRKKRQEYLAIKWLIDSAHIRKSKTSLSFAESLANELFDALKKQGQARQKRDELHRMVEMNRAYIRYRWW